MVAEGKKQSNGNTLSENKKTNKKNLKKKEEKKKGNPFPSSQRCWTAPLGKKKHIARGSTQKLKKKKKNTVIKGGGGREEDKPNNPYIKKNFRHKGPFQTKTLRKERNKKELTAVPGGR